MSTRQEAVTLCIAEVEKATNHSELTIFVKKSIKANIMLDKMIPGAVAKAKLAEFVYLLTIVFLDAYAINHTDDFEIMQARIIEGLTKVGGRLK